MRRNVPCVVECFAAIRNAESIDRYGTVAKAFEKDGVRDRSPRPLRGTAGKDAAT